LVNLVPLLITEENLCNQMLAIGWTRNSDAPIFAHGRPSRKKRELAVRAYELCRKVSNGSSNGAESLENAAEERSYGADADLEVSLSPALLARLGVAYLHAEYVDYPEASAFVPNTALGFGNELVKIDASGNQAVRSPKWTTTLNLQYSKDLDFGRWETSGTYYYNDGFFFDANNRVKQGAYSTLNLRSSLALSAGTMPLTIAVFANNVTHKRAVVGVVSAVFGDYGGYNDPPTVDGEISAEF